MNKNQAEKICELLNLGELITFPQRVEGGLLHLMWHIQAKSGEYAIKELNPSIMKKPGIEAEYERSEKIARAFSEKGISVAISLAIDGRSLVKAENNVFIVYPWVNAKGLDTDVVSQIHAEKIAVEIAKIHAIDLKYPGMTASKWDNHPNEYFENLSEQALKNKLSYAADLNNQLTDIFQVNQFYQVAIMNLNKHLVVSHGDLDQKNVLWENGISPILIDWEGVGLYNPTREILAAALDWSGATSLQINFGVFESVLKAYKNAGGVFTDDLRDAFLGVIGGGLSWMAYNLERSLGMNISSEFEKNMGIDQVERVLKSIAYLRNNMDDWLAKLKI